MNLHVIGIDLGKTVFHLVGLSQSGEVVVRKKFSRTQLLRFTANVQVDLMTPRTPQLCAKTFARFCLVEC